MRSTGYPFHIWGDSSTFASASSVANKKKRIGVARIEAAADEWDMLNQGQKVRFAIVDESADYASVREALVFLKSRATRHAIFCGRRFAEEDMRTALAEILPGASSVDIHSGFWVYQHE